MIKILAWNIQQGGGTRVSDICSAIIHSKANIVNLNEFKNNEAGQKIRYTLLKAGFIHQLVGNAGKSINTVGTFSKLPFESKHTSLLSENFPDAIVEAKFSAFSIYNMYLPHKKKHSLFDLIISEMKTNQSGIFVGDFNSGKQYIDQKSNSFHYSEYFEKMEENQYCDAWRHIHQDAREFSWYSHQGNGFRYDHIYAHENLKAVVKDCYYDHSWRLRKLSDHSPMFLELG